MSTQLNTATIGFIRADGDLQVIATFNNNDQFVRQLTFTELIESFRQTLQLYHQEPLVIYNRQDAPDYVDLG
jgi:hypothetical protein